MHWGFGLVVWLFLSATSKQQNLSAPPTPPHRGEDLNRQIESRTTEALRGNLPRNADPNLTPRTRPALGPINPAQAAKLRIDAPRLPEWVGLIVRMDGEVLVQRPPRSGPRDSPNLDDIVIPAGEHEFRIVSGVSAARLGLSNSVRGEFAVSKKRTLRIEVLNASGRGLKRSARPGAGASLFITIK